MTRLKSRHLTWLSFVTVVVGLYLVWPPSLHAQSRDRNVVYDPALFGALEFRNVGPSRGGRVTAVAGVQEQPFTFYMGSTGGGVWKTTSGGERWENISDGHIGVGSIGAIAVATSDHNVIYAGTGSACIRGNVSPGDGIYKSTDAGQTWSHTGLDDVGQIGAIHVHPRDPEVVYVAALGRAFGPNRDRGVFRSTDGGSTWEKVLYLSDSTGVVDLSMDPQNPRVLFAAAWRGERKPWTIISGGGESGIYRSTDGGDTWAKIEVGLPEMVGRIGIAVSPANSERVYAIVEAPNDEGGLYRSDDGGATFEFVNPDKDLQARPWYYMHVHPDPVDENTLYISNEGFLKSVDGGRSFVRIRTPHGDHHALWINPDYPRVMIQGNDGGATVTWNGGETWSSIYNQPTAEFYTVVVDDQYPYRLYGPQQDNSTISVPSIATRGVTPYEEWYAVAGCETGPIAVDPRNPNVVYGGCKGRINRYDHAENQFREIWVYPQFWHGHPNAELQYRFQWNTPIEISPHNPDVIYHPSQFVHRSTNAGQSWETISSDLSQFDSLLHRDAPGGPISHDQTGVEVYGMVFALEESPHEEGVLWAGTDDGLVHISRDGGENWTAITPSRMQRHSTVNMIELSPHDPSKAYLAVHRYRVDDDRPFIYRTTDYGASWDLLTDGRNGIPSSEWVRVIREDPVRPGLLYAGTEFGLYVSFDDGAHWQPLQLNLPRTPVADITVHRQNLIVATHGRAFWILDDVAPLQQLTAEVAAEDQYLFQPQDTYRWRLGGRGIGGDRAATNPVYGAGIFAYFGEAPAQPVSLEILTEDGEVVRRYSTEGGTYESGRAIDGLEILPGMNRFTWDLEYPGPYLLPGVDEGRQSPIRGYTGGPLALPGRYTVRLQAGEWSQQQSFRVLQDPRSTSTLADMRDQFSLMVSIRDKITETQRAVWRIRSVRKQLTDIATLMQSRGEEIGRAAVSITDKLSAIEQQLLQTRQGDLANIKPLLTNQWAWLYGMMAGSDHRPTNSAYQRFNDLNSELESHLVELQRILTAEVMAFNALVESRVEVIAGVEAVSGQLAGVEGGSAQEPESDVIDLTEVFTEGDVDDMPQQISCPPASYPRMMQQARMEGTVVLEFIVDEEGNADRGSIRALNSTHMAFESPATRMIEGCRFRPGRIRGQAVKVFVRMPVNFVLPEQ
jgi:TonB family protein